jgi:hypothetical protein
MIAGRRRWQERSVVYRGEIGFGIDQTDFVDGSGKLGELLRGDAAIL